MPPHVVSTVILVAHWGVIVGLSLRVIKRRPPVGVSLAWLAVIFSIPFAGAAVYLLFGEKRLGRRRAARMAAVRDEMAEWQASLGRREDAIRFPPEARGEPLDRLAQRVLRYPTLAGNELDLHDDFESIFDALVADIKAATRTCLMGFYIWNEGGRVDDCIDALVEASERGVSCHVLADAMGSKAFLKGEQIRRLRKAGVSFTTALPTGLLRTIFARADLRNHRKIVVIDDEIAYTGSQNLVDPRFFKQDAGVGPWVDAVVRIRGPVVSALAATFLSDWCVETGNRFEPPAVAAPGAPESGTMVQIVPSGPGLAPQAIHQLLLTAIYAARSELILTTPYFVPDDSMITALISAAERGVDLTLIVPARNDSLLVRYASVAHFDDLLAAGAKIAGFQGGLLHTKSITIDGELSVFGSVNLDMRSLWLNFEISLLVYGADFAGRLRGLQHTYLERSEMLDLDTWRARSTRHRLLEDTLRLVGPLL